MHMDLLHMLKADRLHALRRRDAATRIRAMTDDPYKGSCKPSEIKNHTENKTTKTNIQQKLTEYLRLQRQNQWTMNCSPKIN